MSYGIWVSRFCSILSENVQVCGKSFNSLAFGLILAKLLSNLFDFFFQLHVMQFLLKT